MEARAAGLATGRPIEPFVPANPCDCNNRRYKGDMHIRTARRRRSQPLGCRRRHRRHAAAPSGPGDSVPVTADRGPGCPAGGRDGFRRRTPHQLRGAISSSTARSSAASANCRDTRRPHAAAPGTFRTIAVGDLSGQSASPQLGDGPTNAGQRRQRSSRWLDTGEKGTERFEVVWSVLLNIVPQPRAGARHRTRHRAFRQGPSPRSICPSCPIPRRPSCRKGVSRSRCGRTQCDRSQSSFRASTTYCPRVEPSRHSAGTAGDRRSVRAVARVSTPRPGRWTAAVTDVVDRSSPRSTISVPPAAISLANQPTQPQISRGQRQRQGQRPRRRHRHGATTTPKGGPRKVGPQPRPVGTTTSMPTPRVAPITQYATPFRTFGKACGALSESL